jgi:hypothetical protein
VTTSAKHKPRMGRPSSINVTPEDAEILRNAVKIACRYFGVRLQDLGSGSWIAQAMRKKAPMSVDTALALLDIIARPPRKLVGKRRPQGTSVQNVVAQVKQKLSERGDGLRPGDVADLKDDIAAQYYGHANFAALIMQKYQLPVPGTAVFVMPGTSRLVAAQLTDLLPLGYLGKQRRRDIVETLERYFELGEKPLATDFGKELVPKLTYLSLGENLRAVADIASAEGLKADECERLGTWAKDIMRSEGRRKRAKRWGPQIVTSKAKAADKAK